MLEDRTKFHIVAGEALVDALTAETKARCKWTGHGYDSEMLCKVQCEQAARGIHGAEVLYYPNGSGCSVRSDSGLQNFGLLAGSRRKDIDGTLEDGERWAREWVAADPARRYAWRRI